MTENIQLIKRGEIFVSDREVLKTVISTCVSVCIYHPLHRLGGMTHISSSRKDDSTPSGRYIKTGGFYYADTAIAGVLDLLGEKIGRLKDSRLEAAIIGGLDNEGPVAETLEELHRHHFIIVGSDINRNLHRQVIFNTLYGKITVFRNRPYGTDKDMVEIDFSRPAYLSSKGIG